MKKESGRVSEEKAKEFLKKMGHPEIDVVKRQEEASPQIFILDLVLALEDHHQILLKVLEETYLPKTVTT